MPSNYTKVIRADRWRKTFTIRRMQSGNMPRSDQQIEKFVTATPQTLQRMARETGNRATHCYGFAGRSCPIFHGMAWHGRSAPGGRGRHPDVLCLSPHERAGRPIPPQAINLRSSLAGAAPLT
jgi:hypothetical protein